MAATPDIAALRAELEKARALVADWKSRGSPPFEGPMLQARLAAAEAAVANAIGTPTRAPAARAATAHHRHPRAPIMQHVPEPELGRLHASNEDLNRETDARFWAQTGYKVGQKLDAKNPTDRAMMKVWLDVFAKVKADAAAGRLVLTYDQSGVRQAMEDAAVAQQAAVAHLDAAQNAPDETTAAQNAQAAATAAQVAQQRAQAAAAQQPPTVSPAVAQAAATEAHAAAKVPPPNVIVYPVGHPVHWHPNAKPAMPELAQPTPATDAPPPKDAADHLALSQAAAAPAHAAHGFKRFASEHKAALAIGAGVIAAVGVAAVLLRKRAA